MQRERQRCAAIKVPFAHFKEMLLYDVVKHDACIEVAFRVDGAPAYADCWCGKTVHREENRAVYWYGLTPDGAQAYDYDSLDAFLAAPVFQGNSIEEIWSRLTLTEIDGCDVNSRLRFYQGLEAEPAPRPAQPAR